MQDKYKTMQGYIKTSLTNIARAQRDQRTDAPKTEHTTTTTTDHFPAPIERLPCEMWHAILRHLSVVELLSGVHRASKVCHSEVAKHLCTRKSVALFIGGGSGLDSTTVLSPLLTDPKSTIVRLRTETLAKYPRIVRSLPAALPHTEHLQTVVFRKPNLRVQWTTSEALKRLQIMLAEGEWTKHLTSAVLMVVCTKRTHKKRYEMLRPELRSLVENSFPWTRMTALRRLTIDVNARLTTEDEEIDHQLQLPIVKQLHHLAFSTNDDVDLVAADMLRQFVGAAAATDQNRNRDRDLSDQTAPTRTAHSCSFVESGRTLAAILPWMAAVEVTGFPIVLDLIGLDTFRAALRTRPAVELGRIRRLTLHPFVLRHKHDLPGISLAALSTALSAATLPALETLHLDFCPLDYSVMHAGGDDNGGDNDFEVPVPLTQVTRLHLGLFLAGSNSTNATANHAVLGRPELARPLAAMYRSLTECVVRCYVCDQCDHAGVSAMWSAMVADDYVARTRACERALIEPLRPIIPCVVRIGS